MRVNHLIIGCKDVPESAVFYEMALGFREVQSFIDTGTGREGKIMHLDVDGSDLDLMLVPFENVRLPSPQHVAFEVDTEQVFKKILEQVEEKGLKIRAEPSLKSEIYGIGSLALHGKLYQIFYFLDPSGVNVEVMYSEKR